MFHIKFFFSFIEIDIEQVILASNGDLVQVSKLFWRYPINKFFFILLEQVILDSTGDWIYKFWSEKTFNSSICLNNPVISVKLLKKIVLRLCTVLEIFKIKQKFKHVYFKQM